MTNERIEEIIESYLNGNISWVKQAIRTKQELAAIALHMYLYNRESVGLFLETMSK